jgi:hypothetical protein
VSTRRKTPQQKKRESLLKDRRNTYGENSKASRKNIPRRKAQGHQALRRIARQAMSAAAERSDPELADAIEPTLRRKRLEAWTKRPDKPLADVLARKGKRRAPEQPET